MKQWKPGDTLKTRPYQIEKVLGEGGFGITYKVRDLELDIPFVIKTPNTKLQKDKDYDTYVKRFKKEGRILAKLCQNPHPHIVRIFSLFEEDGLPCIVMDFIPGKSLYDLVRDEGKLSEATAIEYIKQIGSALTFCHQGEIIHRDAHPKNILVHSENSKAILIDFGIAGNINTTSFHKEGFLAFAPWEQLAEGKKEATIDIYTLAASLYYLLTDEVPTPCFTRKFYKHELEAPQHFNSTISDSLNQAILKGMEIEPENRPQSVAEWLELLSISSQDPPLIPPLKEDPSLIPLLKEDPPLIPPLKGGLKSQGKIESDNLSQSGLLGGENIYQLTPLSKGGSNQTPQERRESKNLLQVFEFETVQIKEIKTTQVSSGFLGLGKKELEKVILNRRQGKTQYYREDLGNGVTLEMVEIPGGTFTMGSPKNEKDRDDDESPQHQVTVAPFYMGKFTVTQAQYQKIMGNNPSYFKDNPNNPVESISWDDAVKFCNKLKEITGKAYRLPSEAEWEYACRAGTTTPFHFGETITSELANYNGNYTYANEPKGKYREKTTPVGSFPPNSFGLYDMHGNVWEWCADTYHDNYNGAPTDGSAWVHKASNTFVLRGGSWYDYPRGCRCASRGWGARDGIGSNLGFRVVAPRTT